MAELFAASPNISANVPAGCDRPEDLLGNTGLMERLLGAELTAHLGYEEGEDAPLGQSNRRNGTASKRLKGQDGEVPIAVPRDRDGSFEPELIRKGQARIDGMDGKSLVSMPLV